MGGVSLCNSEDAVTHLCAESLLTVMEGNVISERGCSVLLKTFLSCGSAAWRLYLSVIFR